MMMAMPTSATYRNPIIPGFNPDPSIIRVNNDYFLVTSTFEYFPGIPIYHSTDLLNWNLIGHVLTRQSQLEMRTTEPSGGVWAPTLRHHKGRFYISVGCTQRFRPKEWDIVIPRGFYVSTTDIWKAGSWSDPIYFDLPGIDQDLFFDDDDKVYLSVVNQITKPGVEKHGIGLSTFTVEIDLATGRCLTPPKSNCISKFGLGIAEGPHIFKHEGYYYLSTAEGGTDEGHQQWIRRSTEGPFGPWEEGPRDSVNPVIFNDEDFFVRNTGHLDYVQRPDGKWFAVFLGVRPQHEASSTSTAKTGFPSQIGRETFLAPVQWNDGWPVVNNRQKIGLEMVCNEAFQGIRQHLLEFWRDDFSQPELQLGWYHLRRPLKSDYCLRVNPSCLHLYGNAYRIFDSECPSMLLRKQVGFSGLWRVSLRVPPALQLGEEAGTAIWWSQFAYASLGVQMGSAGPEIAFRGFNEIKDAFEENVTPIEQCEGAIQLLIRAYPTRYELFYSTDRSNDDPEIELGRFSKAGEISSTSLTSRISGKESPNTGAHFAIYAQGAFNMPCLEPAEFHFAEWRQLA